MTAVASRTIAAMDPRRAGRRDLVLLGVTVVALSRFLDGPLVWVVAAILLATLVLGTLQVLGEGEPAGVPIESLFAPAVAGVAALGAGRLVAIGPWLVVALVAAWLVMDAALALEARLLAQRHAPDERDRRAVIGLATLLAFLSFMGAGALVPGGLADPSGGAGSAIAESDLALLALADAVVAGLLGYRLAALRHPSLRDALWSSVTYAVVIAIAAGALRVLAVPRLAGPALLALVFYLWDAVHGAPPALRRERRWLADIALLTALGIVVLVLTLQLRG